MAELPSAAPQMFQLPGPSVPYQGNFATGAAAGLQQGTNAFIQEQGVQQQQQQLRLAQQKMIQEKGNAIVKNALSAYDAYGDAAGQESFDAFKQGMNMLAPGSVDPNAKWDNSMGSALKTANDAYTAAVDGKRPWPEAIGVISKTISMAGRQQRERMQPILGAAENQFNQDQTNTRIQSEQLQNTQRDYAAHANPILQDAAALNTVSSLLSKKDPESDALAKAQMKTLISDGSISQSEIDQLTKAGGPFEKVGAWWNNATKGTLDDYHRQQFQSYIPTKISQLNSSLQSLATAFPGAKAASVNARKFSKSKSGKQMFSDNGGQSWQYLQ